MKWIVANLQNTPQHEVELTDSEVALIAEAAVIADVANGITPNAYPVLDLEDLK